MFPPPPEEEDVAGAMMVREFDSSCDGNRDSEKALSSWMLATPIRRLQLDSGYDSSLRL